jgi:hypothetical protein
MPLLSLGIAFVLAWAGLALLLDAWFKRKHRPHLAERLAPFQRPWISDEAERWLKDRDSV